MAVRKLTELRYGDEPSGRIQGEVARSLRGDGATTIADGRLIEGVALTIAFQELAHKLGRKWTMALIVKSDADATLITQASSDDTKFISCKGSAAANVSLWIA